MVEHAGKDALLAGQPFSQRHSVTGANDVTLSSLTGTLECCSDVCFFHGESKVLL